jgi:poly(hydroxyalkanoate) synthase III subunit E
MAMPAPWQAQLESMQRAIQDAAEKWRQTGAAGGEDKPGFAIPIAQFLETYQRSMQAFSGTLPESGDPFFAGLRHVFAGAHDAVGWGVYTRLADASAELARAQAAAGEAQAKAWQQIAATWETARARFVGQPARGEEPVKDAEAFLADWTRVLDAAAQEALQSEAGLAVTAEVNRATVRLRLAQNRVVELWSEIYNVPTRAELDEAYRLIHELRRDVRALKKGGT